MSDTPNNSGSSGRPRRICATDELDGILLAQDPEYRSRRQAVEQFSRFSALSDTSPSLRTGTAHIPVVVHVVYNIDEQNIDINQISEQIRVLNEDFNAENKDLETLQSEWAHLVGKPNIRFFLAKRDANGRPTEGVTRTKTTIKEFNRFSDDLDRRMKFTAQGGKDGWSSDRYLNIWVCKIPILGYATFPAMGAPKEDGVVIDYRAFGLGGTAAEPYHLGRTATHEIGHWLNLRHIAGDDGDANTKETHLLCSGSDLCRDTPNQSIQNYGKPDFPHITCENGPNGDLFRNYMDYSDDDICVMFTKGQVSRMDSVLAGPRSSLLGSDFTQILRQSKTSLPEIENEAGMFFSTDWTTDGKRDLVAINKTSLELQVLTAASGFQENTFTPKSIGFKAESNDAELNFALSSTFIGNGKPDLFIFQNRKSDNKTELTILSGESDYQEVISNGDIAFSESGQACSYAVAKWNSDLEAKPDLIVIKRPSQPGDSYSVGITVLSGESNFRSVLLDTTSAVLDSTAGSLDFAIADWTGDGVPDLVAIKKSNSCAKPTEVSVLSGVSGFQDLILKTETALRGTAKNFNFLVGDWTGDGRQDLIGIKRRDTESKGVEVHILAG